MEKATHLKNTSLNSFLLLLKQLTLSVDEKALRKQISGWSALGTKELIDLAEGIQNLKISKGNVKAEDLFKYKMPLLTEMNNGSHLMLTGCINGYMFAKDPHSAKNIRLSLESFKKTYSGLALQLKVIDNHREEQTAEPTEQNPSSAGSLPALLKTMLRHYERAIEKALEGIEKTWNNVIAPSRRRATEKNGFSAGEGGQIPYNPSNDSGLKSLIIVLKMLRIPFSTDNLINRTGKEQPLSSDDIVFLVRDHLGLQSRKRNVKVSGLKNIPLPAVAETTDRGFVILSKFKDDTVHIQNPITSKVEALELKAFEAIYNNTVILISDKTADSKTDKYNNFGLSWFVSAFAGQRLLFTQVIFSALIMQVFIMITPLFTMIIIDKVLSASGTSTLEVLIIGLAIMTVFDYLVGICRSHLIHHISNRVDLTLVADLFRHLISLPMTFFTGKQTGDTISRIKEVESIRSFLTGSALTALIDFPFSLIFVVVMYFFSPLLCTVVLISIVLSILVYGIAGPFLKARVKRKQEGTTDQQSFLFEVVTSIETIKSLSAESRIQKSWENQLAMHSENASRSEIVSNQINQIAAFMNKATVALCLWLGALAVLNGDMTAGQLIAFNMLVGRVMGPAQRIAQIFQQLQQIKVSTERVREIFQTRSEPSLNSHLASLPTLRGRFHIDNVSFRYNPESQPVLENINLEIPEGQIVGIIGISGSGKSTLMRLIQRLYVPTEGKILIDGINTAEINPEWFRRNIGVVLQDNILLNRTIRENIAFSDPSVDMEKIEQAAVLSGADEFIRTLPKVYDTIVGERGFLLSTGQRQRIALARALVNDPRVIILDEATSALDYESEQIIQNNMSTICKGRTVFIVAHRFSTLRIADRIIALDRGRVVEDGNILQLLKQKGLFARLFALQNIVKPDFVRQVQNVK